MNKIRWSIAVFLGMLMFQGCSNPRSNWEGINGCQAIPNDSSNQLCYVVQSSQRHVPSGYIGPVFAIVWKSQYPGEVTFDRSGAISIHGKKVNPDRAGRHIYFLEPDLSLTDSRISGDEAAAILEDLSKNKGVERVSEGGTLSKIRYVAPK